MSIFSERLVQLRKSRGVSQIAVAEKVGVSPRVYQGYEYGKNEPGLSRLVHIADYFDVSLDYLAGRTDTP